MKILIQQIKSREFKCLNWAIIAEKDGEFRCLFESDLGLHTAQVIANTMKNSSTIQREYDWEKAQAIEKTISRKGNEYFVYK